MRHEQAWKFQDLLGADLMKQRTKQHLLYLGKFHFIHAFSSVPMQESFATEHSCELFTDSLEQFLDGCAVSDEGSWHFKASGWDITDSCLHVVWDPFHEVWAVLVLNIQHLFINFFHGHSATEHRSDCKVSTMTRITSCHHVLCIEHLLGKFWHGKRTVLLGSTAGKWCKARHKEVKTREWYHVHCQLTEVGV